MANAHDFLKNSLIMYERNSMKLSMGIFYNLVRTLTELHVKLRMELRRVLYESIVFLKVSIYNSYGASFPPPLPQISVLLDTFRVWSHHVVSDSAKPQFF